ncbi:MAG: MarR family winged helix-turn-helix transcriptional regulator [Hyphomonadaceae bacterium]
MKDGVRDEAVDYSRSFGGEALAARLRRASERIDRDGTRIYATQKVRFEQRWYGVLRQLVSRDDMSVGEIASALRITHVSVSQACRSMEKSGIIKSTASANDARRRNLSLTPKGRALARRLTPLWEAFNKAAEELNAEAGDLVKLLDRLDDALERKSMFDRIAAQMAKSGRR